MVGVDLAVVEQLGADAFLGTATEEHAVPQDDRHHAFVFQEMEAVEQEGEVGGGFGGEAVLYAGTRNRRATFSQTPCFMIQTRTAAR